MVLLWAVLRSDLMKKNQKHTEESAFFDRGNRSYAYYLMALSLTLLIATSLFLYYHISSDENWDFIQKKYFVEEVKVKQGDSITQIMMPYQISDSEVQKMVKKVKNKIDLSKLKSGQILQIEYLETLSGQKIPSSILIPIDRKKRIKIEMQEPEYPVTEINIEFFRTITQVSGSVNGTIIKSGLAAGVSTKNLTEMVNIYSSKMDIAKEVKKGDKFTLLIEKFIAEDDSSFFYGKTLYASLSAKGQERKFYLFKSDNTELFFDEQGKSTKTAIIKKPLMAKRISSHFGVRSHPILGHKRMHTGVDYAASAGTPIYAAGDGRIIHIGHHGAYGKYIKIRHNQKLHTAYAHLKGFAKGMKNGSNVKQNQVIGYVGSTGRSTAPHLHYEVIINNQFVDPLKISFIPTKQLVGKTKERFLQYKKIIDSFLIQGQKQESQLASSLDNYKFSQS